MGVTQKIFTFAASNVYLFQELKAELWRNVFFFLTFEIVQQ
jgi:hypothetical protein